MKKPKNKFELSGFRFLKRNKVKFKYEPRRIPYILARHYIPDYSIDTPLGEVLIEFKGYLRPEHKAKMVAVKKCNPHLDIRIVFYSRNKQYIKWAERNGFRYSIGSIPKEWLNGL